MYRNPRSTTLAGQWSCQLLYCSPGVSFSFGSAQWATLPFSGSQSCFRTRYAVPYWPWDFWCRLLWPRVRYPPEHRLIVPPIWTLAATRLSGLSVMHTRHCPDEVYLSSFGPAALARVAPGGAWGRLWQQACSQRDEVDGIPLHTQKTFVVITKHGQCALTLFGRLACGCQPDPQLPASASALWLGDHLTACDPADCRSPHAGPAGKCVLVRGRQIEDSPARYIPSGLALAGCRARPGRVIVCANDVRCSQFSKDCVLRGAAAQACMPSQYVLQRAGMQAFDYNDTLQLNGGARAACHCRGVDAVLKPA